MLVLFVIIYILSAQLIYNANNNQNLGICPYPLGLNIICVFYHLILLVISIYYMGWVCGIILFLCHFFAIIHMTIGWTLNIPVLILLHKNRTINSPYLTAKMFRLIEMNYILLSPMLILTFIFTFVSFFVADFKSMFVFLQNNTSVLTYAGIVVVVLSIARIIVTKKVSSNM